MLESREIQQILPHRYPFLLVDRIIEIEEGKRAVGIKNVSGNEPFFQGHFPDYPIMPGVLIMEALAQVGAVVMLKKEEFAGQIGLFAGMDEVRFKKPVFPGDQLRLEVELIKARGSLGIAEGKAFVNGELAAQGKLTFAIRPKPGQ